jgi:replicative DNA helicase
MHDITNYFTVCSKLEPKDFLYEQHEMMMLLFQSLVNKGCTKLDTSVIMSEAQANGIMENIGGIKYLQAISGVDAPQENFNIHLEAVMEAATKYKLYKLLVEKTGILSENAKEGLTSIDLLSSVESDLMSLQVNGPTIAEPVNVGDALETFIEERKNNPITLSGLSTGYPILDKQIDGLIPGTLLVLAARKKMGKSALLTNIAAYVAYGLDIPVLYVDTELCLAEWQTRVLSATSNIKERDIKHGGYDPETYARLKKWVRVFKKGKLFHEYMPGYSVDKLVSLYKKFRFKEKIGLIVFDYLKEPDSTSIDRQRKEYQVLGDVTTKLKDLAGQLNIPAITAVQLNRDNDIADSDRIARYADVICHWAVRDDTELKEGGNTCGTHKLVIKDTRRGGATSNNGIGYMFFKEYLRIKEVPIDRQYFTDFGKVTNANDAGTTAETEEYQNDYNF